MSRRGRSVAAISLFAFQDIITSVCGIVIVIVLLLAVELTNTRAVPEAKEQKTASVTDAMSPEAAVLREEIEELRRQQQSNDSMISRAADLSAVELETRLGQLAVEQENLDDRLAAAEAEKARLAKAAKASKVRDTGMPALKAKLVELETEQRGVRQEINEEENSNRVRFAFPRGQERAGVLVVVSEKQILAGPIDQSVAHHRFVGDAILPGYDNARRDFLNWARQSGPGGYFLFLIRPSGADMWDDLQPEVRSARVDFGFDLIDESEEVFDSPSGDRP